MTTSLLSAPTLSASAFAEYLEAAPLCQCPRSATPTMTRSHDHSLSQSSGFGSGSGSGLFRESSSGLSRDRRSRDDSRNNSRDWRDVRRSNYHDFMLGTTRRSFNLSCLKPKLRRSESDGEPRRPRLTRHSRSMSPERTKSTRSAFSSCYTSSSYISHPLPLKKVDNNLQLAGEGRSCSVSPQPLPCLESCTGPPSPTVRTFASSTTTTLINQETWEEELDDGIIWIVPQSRRGSRTSNAGHSPYKKPLIIAPQPISDPEPISLAEMKKGMVEIRDVVPTPVSVQTKSRIRIERITNWGLTSPKKENAEDKVWAKLSQMWGRRKSA